jgi:RimJ/RimL family protein N-acetyltransferase
VTLDLTGVDLNTAVVRTERLVLRPYRPADVDPVYRACQDPELQRWLTALPSPYTREAAAEFVTGITTRGRAAGTDLSCAVEIDGELVGSAGLHSLTTGRLGPEIGYWIAPWARRQGYASEAASGLAAWAIDRGAPRVHLFADVENGPSQATARRAGFVQEGVVRACLDYRDGSRGDAALFGRLAAD